MIRIATFNLENLFRRPNAMNGKLMDEGRKALDDHTRFNKIIAKASYSAQDQTTLLGILKNYGVLKKKKPKNAMFVLRENRGRLVRQPKGGGLQVVATGRGDWDGWLELETANVEGDAHDNTARVIKEVNADILVVVEVEDRPALSLFNDQVLKRFNIAYPHYMLIDGNDERGIDVGVYSRLPIAGINTNVDLRQNGNLVFSRDCAEYTFALRGGQKLILLANHLKSQGYGLTKDNDERRRMQAKEVARIFLERRDQTPLVIVLGDFNAPPPPVNNSLAPLLSGLGLQDAMTHPLYTTGADRRIGTYGTGTAKKSKLDYILLPPELWSKVRGVTVERRGTYAPRTFDSFPEVEAARGRADASDHAALWVDLDLDPA